MSLRIPLAKPEITVADQTAVMAVLRTPHLSMGPKLREFEQAICDYTGSKYAIAVNSGTSALQLALRALNVERGAEVVLPSFTFSALLNVILQEGLRPRFVDIDPATFNTTPDRVARAITPNTRLILAVHTFGIPVDIKGILKIAGKARTQAGAARRKVHVIEDACEALGANIGRRKAGTLGDAGLFAFYPNKQITTGEGGILATASKQIAAAAARLRNQGRDPSLGLNQHVEIGFSYRLSDINCALGISQLARIESVIAKRQKLAETYDRALSPIAEIVPPPLTSALGRISWFVYPIQLAPEFDSRHRDWICRSLKAKGIATGRYFAPLHRQPILRAHASRLYRLPNTEAVADSVITLFAVLALVPWPSEPTATAVSYAIGQKRPR